MKDLRQWLKTLECEAPEELVRIRKKVDPAQFEVTAVMEKMESEKRFQSALFEFPQSHDHKFHDFQLLLNTFGTFAKMAVALDLPPKTSKSRLMEEILKRQDQEKDVRVIVPKDAPVKENTVSGDAVNLDILPIVRHVDMDGDCYLTPIVTSKNPLTGRYNVSWNRMMYMDEKHLAIYMSPRHLWSYTREAEERNENLPVAVVLGHHPAFHMTGALLTSIDRDEYRAASSFLGEEIRLTSSISYGDDLLIPADAEIVIEGEIVAGKRTVEGPFGEYTGYSGPQRVSWLFEAKAINYRSGGIIIDIFPCKTEHMNAHLPIEASLLRTMKRSVPGVIDTSWVDSGGPLTIIIRMKKSVEGEPMRAAMAAFSASNFIKIAIIVDEEIDPFDLKEVMWAVSTRVQPEGDVQILKNLQGHVLDPSLRSEIKGSGMVIDATKPLDRSFPRKGAVPGEIWKKISLKDYLTE